MPKFSVKLVAALALAGLSLGNHSPASAQENAGELTITDSRPEAITESEQLPVPGDAATSGSIPYSGDYATSYPMMAQGGSGYPSMPGGGVPIRHKEWYGYQNHGPWMRPIRRPLHRVPVQYARYWPTSYYTGGYDPAARYAQPLPVVYQPTDTTQLGFYYQRVPQWQPRPNAIPGPPWPPNWHYTVPTRYGTYEYPWRQNQYSAFANGGIVNGPLVSAPQASYGNGAILSSPHEVVEPQPAPAPTPAVINPDADAKKAVPNEKGPEAPAPVPVPKDTDS